WTALQQSTVWIIRIEQRDHAEYAQVAMIQRAGYEEVQGVIQVPDVVPATVVRFKSGGLNECLQFLLFAYDCESTERSAFVECLDGSPWELFDSSIPGQSVRKPALFLAHNVTTVVDEHRIVARCRDSEILRLRDSGVRIKVVTVLSPSSVIPTVAGDNVTPVIEVLGD